jgi:hypothetical protein
MTDNHMQTDEKEANGLIQGKLSIGDFWLQFTSQAQVPKILQWGS